MILAFVPFALACHLPRYFSRSRLPKFLTPRVECDWDAPTFRKADRSNAEDTESRIDKELLVPGLLIQEGTSQIDKALFRP